MARMPPVLRMYQHSMFLSARLFGLLPVTTDKGASGPNARRSKLLTLYSLLLFCAGSAACVLKTSNALDRQGLGKGEAFRELLLSFVASFQIVVPLLKANDYAAVINGYWELIRKSDDGDGSELPQPYTRTIKVLCCGTVFLYIIPMLGTIVWMFLDTSYQDYITIGIYVISKFSTHVQDTHLMIVIANIRARMQRLNGVLKELAEKKDTPLWTGSSWRARMLVTIQETRSQNFMNAMVARSIESAYSPQLIVSLAIFFVDAFFTLYYLLLGAVYDLDAGVSNAFRSVALGYWTFLTFIEIVIVIAVCDGAVNESAETGNLICQLSWQIEDPEILFELEAFWLQTQHQPVRYRAGQYLQMNHKLIYKMVRLMASYLLWATQMRVHNASTAP